MGMWLLDWVEPFIFEQVDPSNDVIVHHNKDKPYPIVLLVDSNKELFEAEVRHVDTNTVRILLNASIVFTVYVY
jgi:hypothetical protein